MANHCIDVLCLSCGRNWCCRCDQQYPRWTDTRRAERLAADHRRNLRQVKIDDQTCTCLEPNVVIE